MTKYKKLSEIFFGRNRFKFGRKNFFCLESIQNLSKRIFDRKSRNRKFFPVQFFSGTHFWTKFGANSSQPSSSRARLPNYQLQPCSECMDKMSVEFRKVRNYRSDQFQKNFMGSQEIQIFLSTDIAIASKLLYFGNLCGYKRNLTQNYQKIHFFVTLRTKSKNFVTFIKTLRIRDPGP